MRVLVSRDNVNMTKSYRIYDDGRNHSTYVVDWIFEHLRPDLAMRHGEGPVEATGVVEALTALETERSNLHTKLVECRKRRDALLAAAKAFVAAWNSSPTLDSVEEIERDVDNKVAAIRGLEAAVAACEEKP